MSIPRFAIVAGYSLMTVILIGLPILTSAGVGPTLEVRMWALAVSVCSAVIASTGVVVSRRTLAKTAITAKQIKNLRSALADDMRQIAEDTAVEILSTLRNELKIAEMRRADGDHGRGNVTQLRP